jgi:hypothetical protein
MPLNDKDARAVDWIMSQQSDAGGDSSATAGVGIDPSLGARVEQVESILKLLDLLPEEPPPADLVRRTLARILGVAPSPVRPDLSGDSEAASA